MSGPGALRFQAGGTLKEGAFYVERPADAELPEALRRGEFCYVLSTRQIGKSSLRRRTMQRLAAEGVACVAIDLTGIGTEDSKPEDWYFGLTVEIAQQLGLEGPDGFWEARKNLGPVHCFSRYLEEEVLAKVAARAVIFIDEIDVTLSLPFSRDDFFASVRAFYNRRADRADNERLTFCLLGVAAPGDLIADPTRTPFNIGRPIWLEDFTRGEVEALRSGLEGLGRDTGALLDEVFAWTSGHPYMTQRICEDLLGAGPEASVSSLVRARFLERGRTEDANLQYAARFFSDRQDRDKAALSPRMLRLYRRLLSGEAVAADGGDPVQLALRLTGMAAEREEGEGKRMLRARNRVFREVFNAAWVRAKEADRAIAAPLSRWIESGKKDDFVVAGEALAELHAWAEGREDLTGEEQAFRLASVRVEGERRAAEERRKALEGERRAAEERARAALERQRAQRRLITVLIGMIALLALVLTLALVEFMRAEEAQVKAETEAQKAYDAEQQSKKQAKTNDVRRIASLAEAASTTGQAVHALLLGLEAVTAAAEGGEDPAAASAGEQALGDAVRALVPNFPLVGHQGRVTFAAFSPDGERILTASEDGTVRIWRADGQGEPVILRGIEASSAAFSPDSTRVVISSLKEARIWSTDGRGEPIILSGHLDQVSSALFSPDGKLIITASWDKTARIWRADGKGDPIVLRGHDDWVTSAAFSPDGTRVVTSSSDKTARVWRADGQGVPIILQGHLNSVSSAAFSPDGKRVITASLDTTARIWQAKGGEKPIVLRQPGDDKHVETAAFSPDGRFVIATSWTGAFVWDANNHTYGYVENPVPHGRWNRVYSAAFSPDSMRIIITSANEARVWLTDRQSEPTILRGHEDLVLGAAFSPDGTRIVTASSDKTARVWRANGQGEPIILGGNTIDVSRAALSPDGTRVVIASSDKTARVWRVDGQGEPVVLRGHQEQVTSASFSPDGTRVVTASRDTTARVWRADGQSEPVVLRGHQDQVTSATFSPDGMRVVTASPDKSVRVWSADGQGDPIILEPPEKATGLQSDPKKPTTEAPSAVFSHDSKRILVALLNKVRVWSAHGQGKPVMLELDPPAGDVTSAAWSPDGSRVVVTSSGSAVSIYRTDGTYREGEAIRLGGHVAGVNSAAFSPDGKLVVSASDDKTARIWRTDGEGDPIILRGHGDGVTSAAFSADGTRIVTASKDGIARLWRADGQGSPIILRGHSDWVTSAGFTRDGTRVVTASLDGTVRIWMTSLDFFRKAACSSSGRNLSNDEWIEFFPKTSYRKTCPEWLEAPLLRNTP